MAYIEIVENDFSLRLPHPHVASGLIGEIVQIRGQFVVERSIIVKIESTLAIQISEVRFADSWNYGSYGEFGALEHVRIGWHLLQGLIDEIEEMLRLGCRKRFLSRLIVLLNEFGQCL